MNWGIYIIPGFFTFLNMFFGTYSIFSSIKSNYTLSAWLIIISIICDGIDGLLARATKSTSYFGIEFDSFADFVSFCIAPSILMYFVVMHTYKTPGIIVCFIYIMFGAFRLAKFNIKTIKEKENNTKTTYFEGLPTPASAGILSSIVLMFELFQKFENGITSKTIPILMKKIPVIFNLIPLIIILISFLMITKIQYTSFSKMKLSKKVSLRTFLLIVIGLLLIIAYPENVIFIFFSIYLISGIIEYIMKLYYSKKYIIKRNEVKQNE